MEVIYRLSDRSWPTGPYYVLYEGVLVEVTKASLKRSMRVYGHVAVRFVYRCDDPLGPGQHVVRGWGDVDVDAVDPVDDGES